MAFRWQTDDSPLITVFDSVLCLLCLCARLFICALWLHAGKGLTSWLSFVVSAVSSYKIPSNNCNIL